MLSGVHARIYRWLICAGIDGSREVDSYARNSSWSWDRTCGDVIVPTPRSFANPIQTDSPCEMGSLVVIKTTRFPFVNPLMGTRSQFPSPCRDKFLLGRYKRRWNGTKTRPRLRIQREFGMFIHGPASCFGCNARGLLGN